MADKTKDAQGLADWFKHQWERCGQFQHLTLEPIILDQSKGSAYEECYVVQMVFLPLGRPE